MTGLIHALILASVLIASTKAVDIKDCIVDAALVIDNSGSITENGKFMQNWDFVIKFAQDIAGNINIGPTTSHLGLIDFHSYATTHFTLDEYLTEAEVVKAVGDLKYEGYNTNTPEALQYGRDLLTSKDQGARAGVTKLMFIITDGEPSDKYAAGLDDEIAKTKAANIRVIAIGVTPEVKIDTLKKLASTDQDVYVADTFESLKKIKDAVVNENTCKPPPPPLKPVLVDEDDLIASCDAI